jgi:ABC-type branched-subunit amino acid transport system ATPase component
MALNEGMAGVQPQETQWVVAEVVTLSRSEKITLYTRYGWNIKF